MPQDPAAERGALSIDEALTALDPRLRPDDDDGPPGGDASAGDADDGPGGLAAPPGWDEDGQARFADLPPDLQAYVSQRESARTQQAAEANRQAADVHRRAHEDLSQVQVLADQLGQVLPDLVQIHHSRWGDPDWEAVMEQYGPEEAFRLKAQHERETAGLQAAAQARAQAEALAHRKFVADESEKLKTIAPHLSDPDKGPQRRREVGEYLLQAGFTPDILRAISAQELHIAHKAMLWDQAQSRLKTQPPRPGPADRTPQVRPAAGGAGASPQRGLDSLIRRLGESGRIDDAVALLQARRKAP
ncbi:MAG TPA: hypothetical protein VG939_05800 [Caulobacteraceae bacterium]|nr:hypothetical protein [Caulobacteraceae bacterium]